MGEHYIPQALIDQMINDPLGLPPAVLRQIKAYAAGEGNLCGAGSQSCYDAVMPPESG